METKKRRVKLALIDQRDILHVLNAYGKNHEFLIVPIFPKLPEGYAVVGVAYSIRHMAFEVIIEHPSFDEVEPWHEIPFLEDPLLRRQEVVQLELPIKETCD